MQETDGVLLFRVMTPLGFHVQVTKDRWNLIITNKHPVMAGKEDLVRRTLENPEQIRRSKSDPDVYLFYHPVRTGRWVCAVSKRLDEDGFLITTYPTDAVKEGEVVWQA